MEFNEEYVLIEAALIGLLKSNRVQRDPFGSFEKLFGWSLDVDIDDHSREARTGGGEAKCGEHE